MMKYKVTFPTTTKNGVYSIVAVETSMETKEENALWHYNNALAHDGIRSVDELPKGTRFEPIHE